MNLSNRHRRPERERRPVWPQRCLFFGALLALAFSPLHPLGASWVYESTNEFFANGDFDGDGRVDLVIVDKVSGDYRIGYQLIAGTFNWASPRASGIDNVTGFSVAKYFDVRRDALSFTAPAANRVNLFDASSPSVAGLPVNIYPGRSFTLGQDFEAGTGVNYALSQIGAAPGPLVQPPEAGSRGSFLRLMHDGVNNNANAITFDQNAAGLYQTIDAEFDFRLASPDTPADGFTFMLIPTSLHRTTGAGYTAPFPFEEPNLPGVFALAFDLYDPTLLRNNVSLHWNGAQLFETTVPLTSVRFDSGQFHRARLLLRFDAAGTNALATVTITPNILGPSPGGPLTIVQDLSIPGLAGYDCRPEFAARSGALNMSLDLDSIRIQFREPFSGTAVVGPNLVIGLDIGGPDNSAGLDDLFISSQWCSPPEVSRLDLLRLNLPPDLTNASVLGSTATTSTSQVVRGNAVTLRTGASPRAGHLVRGIVQDQFRAADVSGGTRMTFLNAAGLPMGADYVVANFSGGGLAQLLYYAPCQSNLVLRSVQELSPGLLSFTAAIPYPLGNSIQQVVMLPGASDTKLLVIFCGGTLATVFNFNGLSAPASVKSFNAEAGETFTGAGALGNGGFTLFSGRNGATLSTFFQVWNFNGTGYTAGQGGELPALTGLSAPANVFFFSGEPFVNPAPVLVRSLNARDWTSSLLGLPGHPSVEAELFANSSNGLLNPLSVSLGAPPTNTTASLVNQYRDPIALFSHSPAGGDTPGDLTFRPEPGAFSSGVTVTLANSTPATLYYRFDPASAWTTYTKSIPLFKTTTIHAYADPTARRGTPSRIKTATYTITTAPDQLDSDGDGVPDYVEIAKGTDPAKPDTDGDAYSDLDELLNHTNALDTNSRPTTVFNRQVTMDLTVLPGLSADGRQFLPQPGTPASVQNLAGGLLAASATRQFLSTITIPFTNIALDASLRLYSLATVPAFPTITIGAPLPAPPIGRELVGLFPIPTVVPMTYSNAYRGLDLTNEANAWINDAAARLQALPHLSLTVPLTPDETLVAALTENCIGSLLVARGHLAASNLTIFPNRPREAARYAPGQSALTSLESAGAGPAYRLQQIYATARDAVYSGTNPDMQALRGITEAIYRIGMFAVETNGVNYPLPLDVLRDFFFTGNIESNYLAARRASPEEFSLAALAAGRRARAGVFAALRPRPTTNLTLQVRADTYAAPCTLLDSIDSAGSWALLDGQGLPYRLIESFNLVPGARLQVFGFLDVPGNLCGAPSLQVVSIDLLGFPPVADADLNGNGLPDAWEALYGLNDPNGDADGDGATNLQEMQSGTDPRDPNSIVVFTLADSGLGSLRQAILHANATAGPDTIRFNLPGSGVSSIAPLMPLPAITGPLTLDGFSQPGASPNTLTVGNNARLLIELAGQNAGSNANGLVIVAGHCTVRGLVINRFAQNGLFLFGQSNRVAGNFIGTDATGTLSRSNALSGIHLASTSDALIGGSSPTERNVISASGENGISIYGPEGTSNQILGNYIGVNAAGTAALGNGVFGIRLQGSSGNIVGGTMPGAGNLISGNPNSGIGLYYATDNVIEGNRIGTDAEAMRAIPNGYGVSLLQSSRTRIGGTEPAARNIISANILGGISLYLDSMWNVIQGNYIGTDKTGTTALGNLADGVHLQISGNNTVGGGIPGAGNVIGGNHQSGVAIYFAASTNNIILGNWIGTDRTDSLDLGNAVAGVQVVDASRNTIGGGAAGHGNTIAFNGIGVAIQELRATNNALLRNSIHSNSGLGIDLEGAGVTANDSTDLDSGPNRLQNFPLVTAAVSGVNGTLIRGSLRSQPQQTFRLEFFASNAAHPSGYGEGERFLGSTNVVTDATGLANFECNSATRVFAGELLTATATDLSGNTSEFSPAFAVGHPTNPSARFPGFLTAWSQAPSLRPSPIPVTTPGERPLLAIRLDGNRVILNWPASSLGHQLQYSSPTGWTNVRSVPTTAGSNREVTLFISEAHQFFRLIKP